MLSIRTISGRPYRVYILAGNKAEADAYATQSINLKPSEYFYISELAQLYGVRDGILILVGTYFLKDNVRSITILAKQNGMLVVTREEFVPLTTLAVQLYIRKAISNENNI